MNNTTIDTVEVCSDRILPEGNSSLDTPYGQRKARLNDLLDNQLKPLLKDINNDFEGSILSDNIAEAIDRLLVLIECEDRNFQNLECMHNWNIH
jgi:hypothetical protein